MSTLAEQANAALNRLCKWRTIFTGWQLGTRAKGDPEADAVRNHRELTMLLRAEVSALTILLIQRGVFTGDDWNAQLVVEAEALCRAYEKQFPGIKATDIGIEMIPHIAADTMRGWRP